MQALVTDTDLRVRERDAARSALDHAAGQFQRRLELIAALEDGESRLAEEQNKADEADPALAAAVHRLEQANAKLSSAEDDLNDGETELRLAVDDRDHLRRMIEVEQLGERHERVVAAQADLAQAEADLDEISLTAETTEEIEAAHLRVVRAEAEARGGAASIDATALQAVILKIDGQPIDLMADETHVISVTDTAEIVIGDVAHIEVTAGAGSRELSDRLEAESVRLSQLCGDNGVGGLPEARTVLARRVAAEGLRSKALETIQRDLRDLTPDVLQQKVAGLTRGIGQYAAQRVAEPPIPSDYDAARRSVDSLNDRIGELRQHRDSCKAEVGVAAEVHTAALVDDATRSSNLDNARTAHERASRELAEARDQRSDADLDDARAKTEQTAEAAERCAADAQARLQATDPDTLRIRRENARAVAQRASDDIAKARDRRRELEIALEVHGEEGLQTRLDQAKTKLNHLERERDSLEHRANAARVLHDSFAQRRQESRRRYADPFKQRVEQLGKIALDSTFSVELDDSLGIAQRTLGGVTLDIDQLSTGAREQLGIVARLACAAIVRPEGGGAPVIIDDALGWSDPRRLEGMGAAIAAAGQHCQVIILTCTPGRYAHVGNATIVKLPASPNLTT